MRIDEDHRIVGSASTKCGRSGIEDTVYALSLKVLNVIGITALKIICGVVSDEEIPCDIPVLRGEPMKDRHIVVVRETTAFGLITILRTARITTCFKKQNTMASFSQSGRNRATAGSRAYDDILSRYRMCFVLRHAAPLICVRV
jgi:hypothetical protein